MAATFNTTFSHGATWSVDVACMGFDAAALDISTHEKRFLLSRRGVVALELSTTTADPNFLEVSGGDWAAGRLRIKVLPADQAILIAGVAYLAEIWTEGLDGTVYDQAAGTIEVRASGIPLAS